MKTKFSTFKKLFAVAGFAAASITLSAQTNVGADCGCPDLATRTSVDMSSFTDAEGNQIATNVHLTCDKIYHLDLKYYVGDGQSLTIAPGTVIKGDVSVDPVDANALVISRGGKIMAPGTETCPIIFTAAADPLDGSFDVTQRGLWGGVVVLGRATNNVQDGNAFYGGENGVAFIEGFTEADPRILYGMPVGQEDDDDNSGVLTYVSIRHAGASVGAANELNGLTLGSVGRGTTIHHIEITSNLDDGIEFFGGTVNLKYASCLFIGDDNFDWDQGWTGKAQFIFVLQLEDDGDNGFECDGDDEDLHPTLLSNPIVYNATVIGQGDNDQALELKESTKGSINNSIFIGFENGVALQADDTNPETHTFWMDGDLEINNCTFMNTNYIKGSVAADIAKLDADGNAAVASIPGIDTAFAYVGGVVTDNFYAIPTNNIAAPAPAADGFFTPVAYQGAFDADAKSWLSSWSYAQVLNATNGLVPNPTDINNDGVTNVDDLLLVVGKWNQTNQ